ncbi:transposase [Micromonospora sp. NPDC000207]|uniref:transposase n=1 Tax=Micromonospora sp. NPDC000207 TaxID=3154246 RepID=UPI00331FB541
MAETRRQFDPEFRAGAVRIVCETGKSIAQVARDLGINSGNLANWAKRDREGPGVRLGPPKWSSWRRWAGHRSPTFRRYGCRPPTPRP